MFNEKEIKALKSLEGKTIKSVSVDIDGLEVPITTTECETVTISYTCYGCLQVITTEDRDKF